MMTRSATPSRVVMSLVTTAALAAPLVLTAAHANVPPMPSQKSLKPAVKKYLAEKGDFCLGKFEWPIAVTEEDRKVHTHDAVQMPVLEKLGVVAAADAPGEPGIRNYSLTEEGRKSYVTKASVTVNSAGQKIKHPGDLCPAKLELDKVVTWNAPSVVDGKTATTVKFTYRVAKVADWARDPEVRKVFPMMALILDSACSQQLEQLFAWSGHGWVALTPGD